jgi:protocatechuate 3,4-dioxygenase beta subunit
MAQTAGTGVLTGRVTDTSGSVVANATVTTTSVDTGETRTATTGIDGSYKFEGVPTGNYRVKFEAASFKAIEIPSATIGGTEPEVLNEKLEGGNTATANRHRQHRTICPTPRPAVRQHLHFRISAFLRNKFRETLVSRRCSISGPTCSRSINEWV